MSIGIQLMNHWYGTYIIMTHLIRPGPVFLCDSEYNKRQHSETIEEPGGKTEEINQLKDLTHQHHRSSN